MVLPRAMQKKRCYFCTINQADVHQPEPDVRWELTHVASKVSEWRGYVCTKWAKKVRRWKTACVDSDIPAGWDQQTHGFTDIKGLRAGDLSLTEAFREVKHFQSSQQEKKVHLVSCLYIPLSAKVGALKTNTTSQKILSNKRSLETMFPPS